MTTKENDAFNAIFTALAEKYPHRNLEIKKVSWGDDFIWERGEPKINITGYNLLYRVTELTKLLSDELL